MVLIPGRDHQHYQILPATSLALDSHLLTTYASPCQFAESGNVQKAVPGVVLIVGTNREDVPEPAGKLVLRF